MPVSMVLLLMGPGAGTTILNNVALGFANVLPAGPVGIVSAAGTGLQEVSTLLARRGVGITQGIGTGGRDLKKEVGGIMMLEAFKALQEDPATAVLVLISKPPADEVVQLILDQVSASSKPTVICFLGGNMDSVAKIPNVIPARTLYECALLAAQVVQPESGDIKDNSRAENASLKKQANELRKKLNPDQRYLRGLFSGGTLCYEAQVIWKDMLDSPVYSNAPLPDGSALPDSTKSYQHTAVDLGEEEFTVGRPHPMIDNDLRIRRLLQEARDPQVAVIMLDVVIGYGAHPDPASELGNAVEEAIRLGRGEKRELLVVASVTGTEDDPQSLSRTTSTLERAGVIVCDSNSAAARLSGLIVSGNGEDDVTKINDIFGKDLTVLNVGLASMAKSISDQGVKVVDLDWQPPKDGIPRLQGNQVTGQHGCGESGSGESHQARSGCLGRDGNCPGCHPRYARSHDPACGTADRVGAHVRADARGGDGRVDLRRTGTG